MKTKTRPRRLLAAAAVLLAAGVLTLGTLYAQGFWDENLAVHIDPAEIEPSTLAIGSHLIHLSALNDSLYEVAEKSAEESGQNRIYYKSELGGGAWFDISAASSLDDITLGGSPVTDEEMKALFFTHHTKSDKVTYDLRTGQAVNVFDIRDPYDLESMEELQPLKMQYDLIIELQEENDVSKRIDEIWQTPVSGEQGVAAVAELEEKLSGLQGYLNVLSANDAPAEETGKVSGVMAAVDAARRYEVYAVLEKALEEYLDELGGGSGTSSPLDEGGGSEPGGEGDGGEGGESEDDGEEAAEEPASVDIAETDPEMMSAVSESLNNVRASMITYGGKMLDEGVTVMSRAEYSFSNSLIDHAKSGTHSACGTDVQNLILLDNILNDVISDRPRELALLENRLLSEATGAYLGALGQGESGEYQAEKAKGSAQALLNRFIRENEGFVNTCRGELEFLIEAKCSRVDHESGMAFLDERLSQAGGYGSSVPRDDFEETSQASIEAHIEYLTRKFRSLELANGGNEMDRLIEEKNELQVQRLSALDKNDLTTAKELEEQIEGVEEEIRAMEAETTAQIADLQDKIADLMEQSAVAPEDGNLKNELNAAKAELSSLENGLSDGSLGAMVSQLKQDALSDLANAGNAVGALSGLLNTAPSLVLPAMQEVYNELLLNGGGQGLIDTIETAILENPGALKNQRSGEELKAVVDEFLDGLGSGGGTGGLGGAGSLGAGNDRGYNEMTAILALHLYYEETGNRAARQLLASMAQEQANLGSKFIYERIPDSTGNYVPLTALEALTGRRYIWEKNSSLGVLALGSDFHGFTLYSPRVIRDRDGEKAEQMPRMAKYRNCVHIPAEYAVEQFDVQAAYLAGTNLGCAFDSAAMEQAQTLLTLLPA